jgi:hypothetical protein
VCCFFFFFDFVLAFLSSCLFLLERVPFYGSYSITLSKFIPKYIYFVFVFGPSSQTKKKRSRRRRRRRTPTYCL